MSDILTPDEEAKAREMGRIIAEEARKDPHEEALRDTVRRATAAARRVEHRYIMTDAGIKRVTGDGSDENT